MHDMLIWPLSTTEVVLTCHLCHARRVSCDAFLSRLSAELAERLQTSHPTVQIETDPNRLAPFRRTTSFDRCPATRPRCEAFHSARLSSAQPARCMREDRIDLTGGREQI